MSGKGRIFTYDQTLEIFPSVRDLTATAVRSVEAVFNQVQSRDEMELRREELQSTVDGIVQEWADEVTAMGCEVKGLWLVDWNCGNGYYCWRYPEMSVSFFHSYEDGFVGRVPVN